MTYILGASCIDGLVLVADRKVTHETGDVEYKEKLYVNEMLVIGASGPPPLFPKFRDEVLRSLKRDQSKSFDRWIAKLGKFLLKLNNDHAHSLSGEKLDILIGTKTNNKPVLEYIFPSGVVAQVQQYKVIGNAETYGSIFLKQWNKEITMQQCAEIGYFIIKYIEKFSLNDKVGVEKGKPQVCFIPNDTNQRAYEANSEQMQNFEELTNSRLSLLETNLGNLFKK